jgi:hypothetical protein
MSRKIVTTEVLACDICQKEVKQFATCYAITRGYAPVEPFGVTVVPSVYGEMREHVCQDCFDCAILDAADIIKKEAPHD